MNPLQFFTILPFTIASCMEIGVDQHTVLSTWSCLSGSNTNTLTFYDIFIDYSDDNFETVHLAGYDFYYSYYGSSLAIVNSSINTIPASFFIRHSTTIECRLFDINISKIIPGAFTSLNKLECLDISANKMEYVSEGIFNGLHSLKWLDLSQNKIKNISEHAFKGLNNLNYLYLEENEIMLLPDNLFMSQMYSMLHIDISSNKLKGISDTFRYMGLHTLYMPKNEIDKMNFDINVTELYLEGNRITHVTKVRNTIQVIDLSKNSVDTFDDHAFANSLLKKIYLSHNNISYIHKELFFSLFNLTHLYLDHNNISSLPNTCFKDLTDLEYLDLSHNVISKLQYGIFDNIKNLKCINISYNSFSYLNEDLFSHLRRLEQLSMNNNQIQNIDALKLIKYCPFLYKIELDNNFWRCDNLIKIMSDLEKDINGLKPLKVGEGKSFDSENVRGISCNSEDTQSATVNLYNRNSLYSFISNISTERNITNSLLTKLLNEDYRKTSMYNYFNGGFQNSNFFKYLENLKNPQHIIVKTNNLNDSNIQTQRLISSGTEKSDTEYTGIYVILTINTIVIILIFVLIAYFIWSYKIKTLFTENVELM